MFTPDFQSFSLDINSITEYIKDRKQSTHTGPGSRDKLR